jgi:hypothetical protein
LEVKKELEDGGGDRKQIFLIFLAYGHFLKDKSITQSQRLMADFLPVMNKVCETRGVGKAYLIQLHQVINLQLCKHIRL